MTYDTHRGLPTLAGIVLLFLLQGCAGVRIYSASDDEVAKKAKESIVSADLKSSLKPERLAVQDFNKKEQDAVRRNQNSLRDSTLVAILSSTDNKNSWDELRRRIDDRRKALIGDNKSPEIAIQIETAIRQARDAESYLEPLRQTYLTPTKRQVILQCPINESQRPTDVMLVPLFSTFENACKTYTEAKASLERLEKQGGEFLVAKLSIEQIEVARNLIKQQLAIAKKNYTDALAVTKPPPAQAGKLEDLSETLKKRFESLGTLTQTTALSSNPILSRLLDEGKLEQFKARKDEIDQLIQALKGDTPAEATAIQKRLAAISALEKAIITEQPLMSALILEAEFLKQEVDGLQKHITRGEERIALLKKKITAMEQEIFFLNEADKALLTIAKKRSVCPVTGSLYSDFNKGDEGCRLLVAEALSAFINSMTIGRAEQELIDYQLIAQGHEAVLDDSEVALAQTENLILTPVIQISKIYASGFKAEDLSNLINALGFSAIAIRVK